MSHSFRHSLDNQCWDLVCDDLFDPHCVHCSTLYLPFVKKYFQISIFFIAKFHHSNKQSYIRWHLYKRNTYKNGVFYVIKWGFVCAITQKSVHFHIYILYINISWCRYLSKVYSTFWNDALAVRMWNILDSSQISLFIANDSFSVVSFVLFIMA